VVSTQRWRLLTLPSMLLTATHTHTHTHHVSRTGLSICAAVLVVRPYLSTCWAIAQPPGGGTTRRLTLRRSLCLNLTIASMLLGAVLGLMVPPLELR
jgi:hypothetical protein